MIGKLSGLVDAITDDGVILDVNGVGYLVQSPASTLSRLTVGAHTTLLIEMKVSDDAIRLYGFASAEEREWFRLLQTVQNVGSKVALAVLSTLSPRELQRALALGDKAMIGRAPGVGPKLALRIATEMKDKAPSMMAHGVDGPQALAPLLERASVLALGPGLGQAAWGHALWLTALDANKPLVLDADGLNLLVREPRRFGAPTVLTPHPGEAARLLGVATAAVEEDRFAAVRELARRHAAVVVLKGAGSLVADPDGRLDVCPWGNPGMASGGMGDLLTGIVAALLAQGCSAWQAACLGVGLHARAGDRAAQQGERGLLASDLLAPLRALGNGMTGYEREHD